MPARFAPSMPRLRRIATCKPFTTARISGWEPSLCLARALWLQGFADRAIRAAQAGVDEAIKVGHANSVCLALADGASLIAILADNRADAEQFGRC